MNPSPCVKTDSVEGHWLNECHKIPNRLVCGALVRRILIVYSFSWLLVALLQCVRQLCINEDILMNSVDVVFAFTYNIQLNKQL